MSRALYRGTLIAESEQCLEVEGTLYFPPDSVCQEYLKASPTSTHCPWKGQATYFHLIVNDQRLDDAAWTYENPAPKAFHIRDHIAFYQRRGLKVEG